MSPNPCPAVRTGRAGHACTRSRPVLNVVLQFGWDAVTDYTIGICSVFPYSPAIRMDHGEGAATVFEKLFTQAKKVRSGSTTHALLHGPAHPTHAPLGPRYPSLCARTPQQQHTCWCSVAFERPSENTVRGHLHTTRYSPHLHPSCPLSLPLPHRTPRN